MNGEIIVERNGPVVTLTLSNPSRRNSLTFAMYDQFERQCKVIAEDPAVRVLVLRGAGGNFAGGTDIRHFTALTSGEQGVEYEAYIRRVQTALLDLRIPVVAVVEGVCVGGGLVFAALSDLVYCTPDARFGSPIAHTLGNTLSAASLARLHACFGRRRTSQMLLTGELLTAQQALDAGFVTAVEDSQLEARVGECISAILRTAPLSIRSFKELERRIDHGHSMVPTEDVYVSVYGSADFREGVESFLEKRKANFKGA
ncbi:enoyl-CoA hydratase/carnithine racemase [Pseudarthrobacter phenanthrenivorans Sphe3]|uniref:Enoyl-CoA hydratase/carnithine racemase n=1 Tax=Pseudarthrobacter phenanthrenivorans (strain DSM 18606 / JCM 16027 / LMG 23796 / Sphe3) TaxID=930171 RepID=F0M4L0_PSEPM|nr:enoyl-CoA hydratase-related protein [Pseudarthrobacter phenanthrenivorans]ADX74557.1 enoyl-CoA hydratase/carnithine racemase [Pseudarthrobacter phenanthrenivorans Sphe3]